MAKELIGNGVPATEKNQASPVRIDKWMWAVRIYKTRSLATEACKAGHVKIDGSNVKPSHAVKIDQEIEARVGTMRRKVVVKGLLDKRVGAKLVNNYLEDNSPPIEKSENYIPQRFQIPTRSKGTGRPTKKERRQLDSYSGI